MKISILYFSQTGQKMAQKLAAGLQASGSEVLLAGKSKYLPDSIPESHTEWTGKQFESADAIIFVGACGIAVRSIAPFVASKKIDPAVLVIDECGTFVISLLSGHLGGANALAKEAALLLGATPVITTATDLHSRFAVDVFAKNNDCAIFPMEAAKEVSAALLAGEPVGFYSDFSWEGELPEGLVACEQIGSSMERWEDAVQIGIAVSVQSDCQPFPITVHVVPRLVILGLGCRKGKDATSIEQAVRYSLQEAGIFPEALRGIASIDLKKEEAGILAFTEKWNLSFETFSEEELKGVAGDFSASEFVRNITGVDNVCERSAVLASGQGKLIQKKIGADGVTTAFALRDWRIRFE